MTTHSRFDPATGSNRSRRLFSWVCLFAVLAISAIACDPGINAIPSTPTTRPTDLGASLVTQPTYTPLTYGVQAFLWWDYTQRSIDLEHVRLMNFSTVKQIIGWQAVQPNKGMSDWSHADAVIQEVKYRGLKLIARVDSPPAWALNSDPASAVPVDLAAWGSFCHDLAARYIGQIAGYQIWNEPNLSREWQGHSPNPAGYVQLLRTCHDAMKAADPNAIIISAGLAPTGTTDANAMQDDRYLQAMYAAGFKGSYDVLGLNAPGYKSPPETDPGDPALKGSRWQSFRHVEDMRAIEVANGDGAHQIAILEMGWTLDTVHPGYAWFAVSEAQQAQYLVGAYAYAAQHWRPWVGLMVTIYLPDPSWTTQNEEYWWALQTTGPNARVRQSFIDLANMAKVEGDQVIPARDPGHPNYTPLPPMPTNTASAAASTASP